MATSKLAILIETLYKGKGTKDATKDLKALEGQTKESTSKLDMMKGGLAKMAVAAGAAGVAILAAKKAFDFGAEGAQIQRTRDVFDRLTESIGETADVVLGKMRTATMGMVSDSELMRASARTMSMGLASTADEAAKLAEIAVKLGAAMGKEAGPAMEEFGLLLANTSTLRLDTFGISAAKVKARILELRDATPGLSRETAFMTATMEQAEISMDKLGDAVKADAFSVASANVANLTDDLKVLTAEGLAPVVQVLADVTKGMRELGQRKELEKELRAQAKVLGITSSEFRKLEREMAGAVRAHNVLGKWTLGAVEDNKLLAIALGLVAAGADDEAESLSRLSVWVRNNEIAANNLALIYEMELKRNLVEVEEETGFVIKATRSLTGAYDDMIGPTAILTGAYDDQRFIAQGLTWEMEKYGKELKVTREEELKAAAAAKVLADAFQALVGGAARGGISLLNEEFSQLGPQMVVFGGRTADQNRILGEAKNKYDSLARGIVDVDIGLRGLSMSTDEQSEAIGGLVEQQDLLNPLIDELSNIHGSANMVIREATVNQDALNEVLYEGVTATSSDAGAITGLGLALGVLNEQQATAILLQIDLELGIAAIREAYVNEEISADEAKEAIIELGDEGFAAMDLVLQAAIDLHTAIDDLPTEKRIRIIWDMATPGPTRRQAGDDFDPGTGGETRHAGGDFIVPPGFNNDSFPVWVESGERVQVTSKADMAKGGGGSAGIVINYYASGRGTSADAYDLANKIAVGIRG